MFVRMAGDTTPTAVVVLVITVVATCGNDRSAGVRYLPCKLGISEIAVEIHNLVDHHVVDDAADGYAVRPLVSPPADKRVRLDAHDDVPLRKSRTLMVRCANGQCADPIKRVRRRAGIVRHPIEAVAIGHRRSPAILALADVAGSWSSGVAAVQGRLSTALDSSSIQGMGHQMNCSLGSMTDHLHRDRLREPVRGLALVNAGRVRAIPAES